VLLIGAASACYSIASPEGWADPIFSGNTICYSGNRGQLEAYDRSAQKLLWEFPGSGNKQIKLDGIYSTPVLDPNGPLLYFGAYNGNVYALDTSNGQMRWGFNTGSALIGGLLLKNGTLYAGTRSGKLYIRKPSAAAFTVQDAPHLRCLGQRAGSTRIYGCTDMVVDGYSLGSSDDNAATFQPVMSFKQLLGPLTCAPVQTNCQPHWQRIEGVLGLAVDAGQSSGSGSSSSGNASGSHCASAGVDGWCLPIALALLSRMRRAR